MKCPSCGTDYVPSEESTSKIASETGFDPSVLQSSKEASLGSAILTRETEKKSQEAPPSLEPQTSPEKKTGFRRSEWILLGAIVVLALAVGGYFLLKNGHPASGQAGAMSFGGPCPSLGLGNEFERIVALPNGPQGLAWTGDGFLVCRPQNPWGFLRAKCQGGFQDEVLKDSRKGQKINFWCVAFNEKEVVSYTDGNWVAASAPQVFILHDPKTLQIIKYYPAPPMIGGLTWDGTYYWGATRKNSPADSGPSYLYKLDAQFTEIQKWEMPISGCQGLAWVNDLLFWTDFHENKIVLFRFEKDGPKRVSDYRDFANNITGIAYDGRDLWVSEFSAPKLRMLPTRLTSAWLRGDFRVTHCRVLRLAQVLLLFSAGDPTALKVLGDHWMTKKPTAEEFHATAQALDSLGVRDPLINCLKIIRQMPIYAPLHEVIQKELTQWPEKAAVSDVSRP